MTCQQSLLQSYRRYALARLAYRGKEGTVIDGFRVEVTSDEIVRHLEHRIRHHRDIAAECVARAKRLESLEPPEDDEDEDEELGMWPGYQEELQRRAARHRQREAMLIFFRDRVAANEIYRLAERDLRSLEWLPADDVTSLRV
jgi:hypothetical protein